MVTSLHTTSDVRREVNAREFVDTPALLTLSGGNLQQKVGPRGGAGQRVRTRLGGVGDQGLPHQGEGAEEAAGLVHVRQVVDGQSQLKQARQVNSQEG